MLGECEMNTRRTTMKRTASASGRAPASKTARQSRKCVYLIGVSEAQRKKFEASVDDSIQVVQTLSAEVSHVVVNPSALKNPRDWTPVYFCIASGAWLLRPSWLLGSKADEKIHAFSSHNPDVCSGQRKGKTDQPTLREAVALYEYYERERKEKGQSVMNDAVLQRVLILGGRTSEHKLRKADLKSVLEGGGGGVVSEDVWRRMRERPKEDVPCSAIIILNGEKRSALGLDDAFVMNTLLSRIPILYEEYIREAMRNKSFPTLEMMMSTAFPYWSIDEGLDIPEQYFDWMIYGKGERPDGERRMSSERVVGKRRSEDQETNESPIASSKDKEEKMEVEEKSVKEKTDKKSKEKPKEKGDVATSCKLTTQKERAARPEQLGRDVLDRATHRHFDINTMDVDNSDLVMDFTAEIEANKKNEKKDKKTEVEREEMKEDTPSGSAGQHIVVGMQDVDLEGERLDTSSFGIARSSLSLHWTTRKMDWKETVPALELSVPAALAKTGIESCSQPEASLRFFAATFDELKNHTPSSLVHSLIGYNAGQLIGCSEHSAFLPPAYILSRLFNFIAKPDFGEQLDAPGVVYRLLSRTLCSHPPANAATRYYWLQVLSLDADPAAPPKAKKGKEAPPPPVLPAKVAALRNMIKDMFIADSSNNRVQELIVNVLEADLCEEKLGIEQEESGGGGGAREEWTGRATRSGKGSSGSPDMPYSQLEAVPLAYTVWFEAGERRKRGLDSQAMHTALSLLDAACDASTVLSRELTFRLLRVCLEALRMVCGRSLGGRSDRVTVEMQQDTNRLLRQLTKRGMGRSEAAALLRIDWIVDIASQPD